MAGGAPISATGAPNTGRIPANYTVICTAVLTQVVPRPTRRQTLASDHGSLCRVQPPEKTDALRTSFCAKKSLRLVAHEVGDLGEPFVEERA